MIEGILFKRLLHSSDYGLKIRNFSFARFSNHQSQSLLRFLLRKPYNRRSTKVLIMEKVSAACAMEWSIKLEKSLRSKNPVKAVEAILETGGKLEQWSKEPEPAIAVYNLFGLVPEEDKIFSNTILLRLVEAFCVGDKLVKLAVVRVFMSMFKLSPRRNVSESATWFLSKARVHNHLEILIRVKNVYDKGDTEAKALALILFGCWRDFASEFAPVRYLIFTSMVSSHDLEVRSALFAAACFCEVADDFALVVLGMLHDMVKFPEIMPKTRLAAVRVFAKMGCSHAIANRAFKVLCLILISSASNAQRFACIVCRQEFSGDERLNEFRIEFHCSYHLELSNFSR